MWLWSKRTFFNIDKANISYSFKWAAPDLQYIICLTASCLDLLPTYMGIRNVMSCKVHKVSVAAYDTEVTISFAILKSANKYDVPFTPKPARSIISICRCLISICRWLEMIVKKGLTVCVNVYARFSFIDFRQLVAAIAIAIDFSDYISYGPRI
jgi:hypothetical protein